ncbi:hypothetical protein [Anaerovorax odorimutans]|uniref:hypothetical protein n=1 Tax=Anaerovorax odorimutans TaxID=109327 RepID=UPI00040932B0|nr:hypothetical protein [Anaerovorax odorimutans]
MKKNILILLIFILLLLLSSCSSTKESSPPLSDRERILNEAIEMLKNGEESYVISDKLEEYNVYKEGYDEGLRCNAYKNGMDADMEYYVIDTYSFALDCYKDSNNEIAFRNNMAKIPPDYDGVLAEEVRQTALEVFGTLDEWEHSYLSEENQELINGAPIPTKNKSSYTKYNYNSTGYDNDVNLPSWWHKTPDEMTDKEFKEYENYVEWLIKNADE